MSASENSRATDRFRHERAEFVALALSFVSVITMLECLSVLSRRAENGLEVEGVFYVLGIMCSLVSLCFAGVAQSRWVAQATKSPPKTRQELLYGAVILLFCPILLLAQDYRVLDLKPLPFLPLVVNLPGPVPEQQMHLAAPSTAELCRYWETDDLHTQGVIVTSIHFMGPEYFFCEGSTPPGENKSAPDQVYVHVASAQPRAMSGFVDVGIFVVSPGKERQDADSILRMARDFYALEKTPPPADLEKAVSAYGHQTFIEPFGTVEVSGDAGHYIGFRATLCATGKCTAADVPQLPADPRYADIPSAQK